MTLEQAKSLKYGDYIHSATDTNADGTPMRWRVTGKVKTWKRSPNRVYVPLKRGMYEYGHLDENNIGSAIMGYGI